MVTEHPAGFGSFENHLPQPADDATVTTRVKTILDQIEIHVENFYQQLSGQDVPKKGNSIAIFDSSDLPDSLASLLERTTDVTPIIKHALAHFVASSISIHGRADSSFLPREFTSLPTAVLSAKGDGSAKPGDFPLT